MSSVRRLMGPKGCKISEPKRTGNSHQGRGGSLNVKDQTWAKLCDKPMEGMRGSGRGPGKAVGTVGPYSVLGQD